jgi:hypothetical protein
MKTVKILFLIPTLAIILVANVIFAGGDSSPVKYGNKLVCSDCVAGEPGILKTPTISISVVAPVTYVDLAAIMPMTPKEATFEDEIGLPDSLILKNLKPIVPAEATFNDDDPIMTFTINRLAPRSPLNAGFDDVR